MVTVKFAEVKRQTSKRIRCRSCEKSFARSRTFYQTLNPWNKNAAGQPKTRAEIWQELGEEAAAWQPADLCGKCSHTDNP